MDKTDDCRYFRDREAQCLRAAAQATDPSARVAHLQLARFYAQRLASAEESAALRASGDGGTHPAAA